MTTILTTIRLLDENKNFIDGIIVASDEGNGGSPDSVVADFDVEEPEDIDSLPPLTAEEEQEASAKLAAVFSRAIQIDMSEPTTFEHEVRVARAVLDVALMGMEDENLADKLRLVRFVQINPCPPVRLGRALELLETMIDQSTLLSIKAKFLSATPSRIATHATQSTRPS